MLKEKTLPVTVDKSHLITIGERLYSRSVELIRELVNNAYDADATEVKVNLKDDEIVVSDNGTGMDLKGLKQYFNIGSPEKIKHGKSTVYKRQRIGQFGIGKFATLSACNRFEVHTQKKDFGARVTFDKDIWEQLENDWRLPLEIIPSDVKRGDGTTVTLTELNKKFDLNAVRQCILESAPLKAPHFSVFLNGLKLTPQSYSGQKIPFLEGTKFGPVFGEIVIVPSSKASINDLGIEIKVKQVMIKRDLFGMEQWGKEAARIKGEVNADFLPITSDRTGFVADSKEYLIFLSVMEKIVVEVEKNLGRLSDKKQNSQAKRALKEALSRVEKALTALPDLSPFGSLPVSDGKEGIGEAAVIKEEKKQADEAKKAAAEKEKKEKTKETQKKKAATELLTPNAVVKNLKIGGSGVSCCLDHFGFDGPEVFTEGTIIYINRDHPLHIREMRKRDTHILNVARLITQEISLMKDAADPRQAYQHQSTLLKEAFAD